MFSLWRLMDERLWDSEYLSGADTAIVVVNTAEAITLQLYSCVRTPELLGLTFLHGLVPHLVGLQRNKEIYIIYHKHHQFEIVWAFKFVYRREGSAQWMLDNFSSNPLLSRSLHATQTRSRVEMVSQNRAFHGSLDYSHFLLRETLPTKEESTRETHESTNQTS